MTLQPSEGGFPDRACGGVENKPAKKAPFVRPRLVCYGRVVDLTQHFGGSLTPNERENPDSDDPDD
jgi:hypothetical protein